MDVVMYVPCTYVLRHALEEAQSARLEALFEENTRRANLVRLVLLEGPDQIPLMERANCSYPAVAMLVALFACWTW